MKKGQAPKKNVYKFKYKCPLCLAVFYDFRSKQMSDHKMCERCICAFNSDIRNRYQKKKVYDKNKYQESKAPKISKEEKLSNVINKINKLVKDQLDAKTKQNNKIA